MTRHVLVVAGRSWPNSWMAVKLVRRLLAARCTVIERLDSWYRPSTEQPSPGS